MTRIVTYAHRPKRAPRKKAQAAAITGPAIVTATSKRNRERGAARWSTREAASRAKGMPMQIRNRRDKRAYTGEGVFSLSLYPFFPLPPRTSPHM